MNRRSWLGSTIAFIVGALGISNAEIPKLNPKNLQVLEFDTAGNSNAHALLKDVIFESSNEFFNLGVMMAYRHSVAMGNGVVVEQELLMEDGTWTILKKDEEICIVDPEGRCRHQSKGHVTTAVYLAMEIAKNKFESESNLDEALRLIVKKFKNS